MKGSHHRKVENHCCKGLFKFSAFDILYSPWPMRGEELSNSFERFWKAKDYNNADSP